MSIRENIPIKTHNIMQCHREESLRTTRRSREDLESITGKNLSTRLFSPENEIATSPTPFHSMQ